LGSATRHGDRPIFGSTAPFCGATTRCRRRDSNPRHADYDSAAGAIRGYGGLRTACKTHASRVAVSASETSRDLKPDPNPTPSILANPPGTVSEGQQRGRDRDRNTPSAFESLRDTGASNEQPAIGG